MAARLFARCDHLLMDPQDPQQRIAELERQLADAKAAAGGDQPAERSSPVSGSGGFWAPRRTAGGNGWIGPIVAVLGGVIGLCIGGGAAVTAVIPSSALWMSPIVWPGAWPNCRRCFMVHRVSGSCVGRHSTSNQK
jgi:hypothetical protein